MEKSHVSLEQKLCIVTGKPYDTNALLLDTRFKNTLDKHSITGWGFSPEVEEKITEGFIALVEVDYTRSEKVNGFILPENAYRLGRIAYIKSDIWKEITGQELKKMSWAEPEFMDFIENLSNNSKNENI